MMAEEFIYIGDSHGITVHKTVDVYGELTTQQIAAGTATYNLYTDSELSDLVAGSTVNLQNNNGRFTGTLAETITSSLTIGTRYYGKVVVIVNDGTVDVKSTTILPRTAKYKEG